MAIEYTILTPEKVAVQFRLAGVGSRVWAYLLDLVLQFVMLMVLSFVLSMLAFRGGGGFAIGLLSVSILLVFFGYPIFCEAMWNGQTLGKRALGIRVKMIDGSPITPAGAFTRNMLRIVDIMPATYTVGICAIFFTEHSQRLGDLVANTIVVHERKNANAIPIASPISQFHHPLEHLVGELRDMTMAEYLAVKTLCDRYPELTSSVQDRLTREVWLPFANRHRIPSYHGVHPVYLMEASVMQFARRNGLL